MIWFSLLCFVPAIILLLKADRVLDGVAHLRKRLTEYRNGPDYFARSIEDALNSKRK